MSVRVRLASMVTIGHLLAMGRLCTNRIGRLPVGTLTVLGITFLSVSLWAMLCLSVWLLRNCRLIWPDRTAMAYLLLSRLVMFRVAN